MNIRAFFCRMFGHKFRWIKPQDGFRSDLVCKRCGLYVPKLTWGQPPTALMLNITVNNAEDFDKTQAKTL